MKIKNVRGYALEIGVTGQLVNPDETVEVDDLLGKSLCEQEANWKRVTTGSKSKTADDGDKQEDQ